jgi:lipopolysaccharide transport system ATP-binding protein
MSDVVIRVENLSKRYRIGERERYLALRDILARALAAPFRRFRTFKTTTHTSRSDSFIWALKDISFEVKQGDVVGIIGRNGAGKSTLLKILSRITEPTEGHGEIRGRVGSLLEVGTGFHPELTGRENIYLNGAILGMKKAEIDRKFDEIVAFAEVEKFIDTAVKHYSSGMRVRLAFAVAAHLESEILLVDEVLAVGDVAFQKKCLGKMGHIAREGRTVLFVSHNMAAISKLCRKALLINSGQLAATGETSSVTGLYLREIISPAAMKFEFSSPKDAAGAITGLRIIPYYDEQRRLLHAGEPWSAAVCFTLVKPLRHCMIAFGISTGEGQTLHTFWSHPQDIPVGSHIVSFNYDQIQLSAGVYRIALGLSSHEQSIHYLEDAGTITVGEVPAAGVEAVRTQGTGYLINSVPAEVRIRVAH